MKRTGFILLLILVLFVMNLLLGSVHIPFVDVLQTLCGNQENATVSFIILDHRLPQAITAMFVGAALATAGLLLQTAFHNPLAGPSVLGISGGASLGVAMVMMSGVGVAALSLNTMLVVYVAAFVGAMAVTVLLLVLSNVVRNNLVLLITGLLLGYLISALITILYSIATPENMHGYVMWGMGDFSSVSRGQLPVLVVPLVVLIGIALLMTKTLNALLLGDSYAQNLGVNIKSARSWMLFLVGSITAVCTSFCGPVSFIGLAVPHIARICTQTSNFRSLLPITILLGAAVALLCNLLCVLPADSLLPLNAVTPIIGVPVIIYVLIRRKV